MIYDFNSTICQTIQKSEWKNMEKEEVEENQIDEMLEVKANWKVID